MSTFLPKDYKAPSDNKYFKLRDGENRFRVLSSAIVGMEYWKTVDGGRKPIRKRQGENIEVSELEVDKNGELQKAKHFWSFVAYNYQDKAIQILELTQKTIQQAITAYVKNPKWGDPKEYDIIITRAGEGFDTVYTVTVDPKEKLDGGIEQLYKDTPINLEALFDGADPFASEVEKVFTPDSVADDIAKEV